MGDNQDELYFSTGFTYDVNDHLYFSILYSLYNAFAAC